MDKKATGILISPPIPYLSIYEIAQQIADVFELYKTYHQNNFNRNSKSS
jgi:hypothetical protein